MNVSDDLTALVFELRRAGSPAEKARALARAWRTIRGLNPTDRRLLAREAGFDGVEDLIEGLARKGGGAFAPAAILAALGKMRDDEGLSVRGAIADLRDPGRRDDLLARGLDLAARSFDRVEEEGDEVDEALVADEPAVDDGAPAPAVAEAVPRAPHPRPIGVSEIPGPPPGRAAGRKPPVVPPPPPSKEAPATDEEPAPEPTAPPEERESSVWEAGLTPARESEEEPRARWSRRAIEASETVEPRLAGGSVLDRLRVVRRAIPELRTASPREIQRTLENLPELWARRRAVVALIEAGVPAGVGDALDLVEDLDRPLDRSWCLAALARRGGLEGDDLGRALTMLASPAARRRIEALAGRAR
jgi:hypothetical protein